MAPRPRMLATTVYLTEDQCDELRRITRETGIPQAVVIRAGIDAELERRRTDREGIARRGG